LSLSTLAIGCWLTLRKTHGVAVSQTTEAAARAVEITGHDEELESLLSRADEALKAGALVAPSGASAAYFYRQALRRNSSDPRAANGVEKVVEKLLSGAEEQLASQHIETAQKLTDQARTLKPDHLRVVFLAARIAKERERAQLAQARQAAAESANTTPSISTPDNAATDEHPAQPTESTVVVGAAAAPAASQLPPAPPQLTSTQPAPTQPALDQPASPQLPPPAAAPPTATSASPPTVTPSSPTPEASPTSAAALPVSTAVAAPITEREPAQDAARSGDDFVPANVLEISQYSPPVFPVSARERGVSGWVDLKFIVNPDGSVSDVVVTGAQPTGYFEQSAVEAVRHWHYKPILRGGQAVSQRARLHLRFALQN
jgi:protein TonB